MSLKDMTKFSSLLFLGLGLLVTIMAGVSLGQMLPPLLNSGEAPLHAPVAGAPAKKWLVLEDAKVRCETRSRVSGGTYFQASALDGSEPFILHVLDDVPCEAVKFEGGFLPEQYEPKEWKKRLGMDPPPGVSSFRVFSQILEPRILWRGVATAGAFLALGALMLFAAGRSYRRASANRR